eukprot:TRINITY_DN1236_c0_g1_i1.p1 TRINITY_DN1236_c0_g1~~TRINITY_DN1236_c0_g1_i1.p1  ORF type:complete len:373 (-),score=59.05 TRINITY_DN1236_c0_g1_i1:8-1126(-)
MYQYGVRRGAIPTNAFGCPLRRYRTTSATTATATQFFLPFASSSVITIAPSPPPSSSRHFASAPAYKYPLGLSPAVEFLIHASHLDAAQIKGTGPRGRVLKGDVIEFLGSATSGQTTKHAPKQEQQHAPQAQPLQPSAPRVAPKVTVKPHSTGEFEDVPNSSMRKVIARRLTESKQTVPHSYTVVDCDITELINLRRSINESERIKLSVNDFIIRALALALQDTPAANAGWQEDAVRSFKSVDVSVAVATPKGLLTPIIKAAHTKGLLDISLELKALANKAREGKLKPEEYQGGTASVSNLGMFGIDSFSAVINPPQSVILAVGQARQVLVPLAPDRPYQSLPCTKQNESRKNQKRAQGPVLSSHADVFDGG